MPSTGRAIAPEYQRLWRGEPAAFDLPAEPVIAKSPTPGLALAPRMTPHQVQPPKSGLKRADLLRPCARRIRHMQTNAVPTSAPGDRAPSSEEPAPIEMTNQQHYKLNQAMPVRTVATAHSPIQPRARRTARRPHSSGFRL